MNAKTAVARRIQALCLERNIAINALANQCGVAPSTIYSMLNTKSKNPGIVSIQKICDGLEISVREFFDDPLFENLEPEIKQRARSVTAPGYVPSRDFAYSVAPVTVATSGGQIPAPLFHSTFWQRPFSD